MLDQAHDERDTRWIYRCARCAASVGMIDSFERLPSVTGPLGSSGMERVLLCIACYDEFKLGVLWPWVVEGVQPKTAATEGAS